MKKMEKDELGMMVIPQRHFPNPIWLNSAPIGWKACQLKETKSPQFLSNLKRKNLEEMNKKKRDHRTNPLQLTTRCVATERKRWANKLARENK